MLELEVLGSIELLYYMRMYVYRGRWKERGGGKTRGKGMMYAYHKQFWFAKWASLEVGGLTFLPGCDAQIINSIRGWVE